MVPESKDELIGVHSCYFCHAVRQSAWRIREGKSPSSGYGDSKQGLHWFLVCQNPNACMPHVFVVVWLLPYQLGYCTPGMKAEYIFLQLYINYLSCSMCTIMWWTLHVLDAANDFPSSYPPMVSPLSMGGHLLCCSLIKRWRQCVSKMVVPQRMNWHKMSRGFCVHFLFLWSWTAVAVTSIIN